MHNTKHTREESTLVLKLRADTTRSPKQRYDQWPQKRLTALSGEGHWSQVFTFPLFNHSVSNRLKISSDVTC